MKAILVIDEIPPCCVECPLYDFDRGLCFGVFKETDWNIRHDERMEWCPLKQMPKAKEPSVGSAKEYWFACGFNDCLEEITDESNISD